MFGDREEDNGSEAERMSMRCQRAGTEHEEGESECDEHANVPGVDVSPVEKKPVWRAENIKGV